jgi:hypothetical protein
MILRIEKGQKTVGVEEKSFTFMKVLRSLARRMPRFEPVDDEGNDNSTIQQSDFFMNAAGALRSILLGVWREIISHVKRTVKVIVRGVKIRTIVK